MFYILHLAFDRFPSSGCFAAGKNVSKIESDMVDYLNPAEDGEASEEAHVAADKGDEGGEGDLYVLLHNIVSRGPDVKMDYLQCLKIFIPAVVVLYLLFVKLYIFDKIPLEVVVFQDKFVKPFLVVERRKAGVDNVSIETMTGCATGNVFTSDFFKTLHFLSIANLVVEGRVWPCFLQAEWDTSAHFGHFLDQHISLAFTSDFHPASFVFV